jgi:hypothetical protein
MTGPTHYSMAEFRIGEAQDAFRQGDPDGRAASHIAMGQLHATLALTAATALGTSGTETRAWTEVAGTKLSQG